jgi:hypothetical protein
MAETAKPKTIHVTVTFPIAASGPYQEDTAPETSVGDVRTAAMGRFGVADDPQFSYYLTHSGQRVADEQTLGVLADHAHALKFTLVKELVQGNA